MEKGYIYWRLFGKKLISFEMQENGEFISNVAMEDNFKIDKRFRNFGFILILIAILILTYWMVYYLTFPNKTNLTLAYIGIAILMGGILLVTRIQFIIWMEKRARGLLYFLSSR